jgi:hypothetical protein
MRILFGIEITDADNHDIIEPFLEVVTSYIERHSTLYIFASIRDANYIKNELAVFNIVEAFHELYFLDHPSVWTIFDDYGFQTGLEHIYLIKSMVTSFTILDGLEVDKELALLQFDELLIARDDTKYFVDLHHQELIENIAKAYNITVNFFELDKYS